MRIRLILLIACVIAYLTSGAAFAMTSNGTGGTETPIVTVTPPPGYTARKIALFPLDLPSYAIRAGLWPVGAALNFLERKHVVEHVLDFLSNDEKTFWVYPIIEGGAGSGFGGGLGIKHSNLFHKNYKLGASYRIHINEEHRAAFSFGKPNAFEIAGRPVSYSIGMGWQRLWTDDFFGAGNGSQNADHSQFGLDDINTGAALIYEFAGNFILSPYLGYSVNDTRGPKGGSFPATIDFFNADQIPGYGLWLHYFSASIRFAHDTRNNLHTPERGGLHSATFTRFQCLNATGFNYNQYELDLRQYLRLWRPRQVLVLHTGWKFQQETDDNNTPFWRSATLDAGTPLRGFTRGRFRDHNLAIFNAEYRYPVWNIIDGVIFYDTGRVFNSLGDFTLDHLKYSIGGGVRLSIPDLALFRLEAAYGGEGINVVFGATQPL